MKKTTNSKSTTSTTTASANSKNTSAATSGAATSLVSSTANNSSSKGSAEGSTLKKGSTSTTLGKSGTSSNLNVAPKKAPTSTSTTNEVKSGNVEKQNLQVPSKSISLKSEKSSTTIQRKSPTVQRSVTKSPVPNAQQPKDAKIAERKPPSRNAVSKPKTTHDSRPKLTFKDLPSDVILIIFDFYGGLIKNKPNVFKDGKFDNSKFIKKYYGRFLDKQVKFLFRYLEGEIEDNHDIKEITEIYRIPLLFLKSRTIKIEGNLAKYLFNCPLKESPTNQMQRLTTFVSLLGEECKRVKVLDVVNMETVVTQFELAFKSFPCLEVIRGGKNMIKSKYTDHAARFHYFEEEMSRALEHGGSNVKEITWIGSMIPKSLPFITPNLEILTIECPSSILSLSDSFSMWQKLRELSFTKKEIYTDYNPPPVNIGAYNTLVNHLVSMENLSKLSIKMEEAFPMQSFKLLEHKRSLTHLNLVFLKIDDEAIKTMGTMINLKEIKINVGYFHSKSLENWINLKQLESVTLDQCSDLTEVALDYLSQMTSLKKLCFPCRNIRDKGALQLVSLKKLEYLDLSCTLISSSCVEPLFKSCRKLKTFVVRSCKNMHIENMKEDLKKKLTI